MAGSLMRVARVGLHHDGEPVSAGRLFFWEAGTATPLATYSDAALTTLNANPVILDSQGRAVIYLQARTYKVELRDSANAVLWTQDCWSDLGQLATAQPAISKTTVLFDLDNGAGVTVDDVISVPSFAKTITKARVVYSETAAGTVAAGNARIGTTLGGSEVVAATAYVNGSSVGSTQALTIVAGAVASDTPIFVRHTGVAAVQAGKVFIEIEFTL